MVRPSRARALPLAITRAKRIGDIPPALRPFRTKRSLGVHGAILHQLRSPMKATDPRGRRNSMRYLLEAFLVCTLTLALPAAAQEEGPPVPVDKAAYHVPVFRNDYVALLRVNTPPQRSAGYHIHSTDQISVLIEEADQAGQVLGQAQTPPRRNPRGGVTYTAYSKKAMTHRVNNVGATAFHNIVITLGDAQPGRFSPGLRDGAGYTQIID